jgi:hypothetical protein
MAIQHSFNQFSSVLGSAWTKTCENWFVRAFYFIGDTFDGILIPMRDVLESELMTMTGRLQPRRTVDEKD